MLNTSQLHVHQPLCIISLDLTAVSSEDELTAMSSEDELMTLKGCLETVKNTINRTSIRAKTMNIKTPSELDPDTPSHQLDLLAKTNERYYEVYDTLSIKFPKSIGPNDSEVLEQHDREVAATSTLLNDY